ncbi:MAG: hypothetical protein QNJ36_11285 [Calothrix sp. MO_167.B42]|nr:hypothetical protein [Calothrix sp. MO_167.B42]
MIELDKIEDELIVQFKNHSVFQNIKSISQEKFLEILIQRRFLSLTLTTVYDIAIDSLTDLESIKIARQILREEYPDFNGNTPSHREDLVYDLMLLGATKLDIVKSRPSDTTNQTIKKTLALVCGFENSELCDVKLLTMLRFWGEVLVSVEYGEFWKRIKMSKYFSVDGDKRSRFYYPHFCHDSRETMAEASLASATHSGRLGARLREMLTSEAAKKSFIDEAAKKSFIDMERKILDIKLKFYDQFIFTPTTVSDCSGNHSLSMTSN